MVDPFNFSYYFYDMESIKNILVKRAVVSSTGGESAEVVDNWEENLFNLFLTGKPGVGKTYHARGLLNTAISNWNLYKERKGHDGFSMPDGKEIYKFYTCGELMMYSRVASRQIDLYESCIRFKGLVLDDLGVGKKSDFIPDIIYMVVDKRLELGKPTIVTSNLKLAEISELIDDRLASRLASYEYKEITGEDRRLELNKP